MLLEPLGHVLFYLLAGKRIDRLVHCYRIQQNRLLQCILGTVITLLNYLCFSYSSCCVIVKKYSFLILSKCPVFLYGFLVPCIHVVIEFLCNGRLQHNKFFTYFLRNILRLFHCLFSLKEQASHTFITMQEFLRYPVAHRIKEINCFLHSRIINA